MVRLKYNEEPNDKRLSISRKINDFDKQSDVVWMSYAEWFMKSVDIMDESKKIPKAILDFIPKWREKAKWNLENQKKFFCPIKNAATTVYFNEGAYLIDAGILKDIGNIYTKQWIYDSISRLVEADMYSIGAIYVRYHGMID